MKRYDVIIVGAGPAGLNCAYHLGDKGLSVLMIEQNAKIGPKVCAGGITSFDINYLKLPHSLIDNSFKTMVVHGPSSTDKITQKTPFLFTIDREKLGQWMSKRLSRFNNISILTGKRVVSITDKTISLSDGSIVGYKSLVGADGSCSVVRGYLKLSMPKKNVDVAVQYLVRTKKYKNLELFFDSEKFSAWYAWIFPHKEYVSIGCGCDPRVIDSKQMISHFKGWLAESRIDVSKAEYQAFPINYDLRGYQFGNIYLAGDAAGLASGLTGEGIHQALISGEEVACIILDKDYVPSKMSHLIRHKHMHNAMLAVLEKSGKFRDIEYSILLRLLKNRFVDYEF